VRYLEADLAGAQRMIARTTTRIDLREQVLNFPSQPVITKDNVTIDIDAVLYYRIADPQKATYAVQNLPYALETLTRTTLRNIVGEMELDATLASRDQINGRMREVIEEAAHQLGRRRDARRAAVDRAAARHPAGDGAADARRARAPRRGDQRRGEQARRVLEAEGARESQVRRAEGEREAAVLRAQGQAEARLAMAMAEAEAIRRIGDALPEGQAANYLLGVKYLEALPALAQGKGSTIFLPSEAAGVMGALGGLRALLGTGGPVSGTTSIGETPRVPAPRVGAPGAPAQLGAGGLFPPSTIAPLPAVGRSALEPVRPSPPDYGSDRREG
jgi:regulator of protease activity HflC (stomatin/prohibitin superfamily)